MVAFGRWEEKRILVTVKTYPVPAAKGAEVSCTAGVTADGEWIRLFPIPFRRLEHERKFRKYEWIEARVAKARNDVRPESHHVDLQSINVASWIPPDKGWAARKQIIFPLKSQSLCSLKAEQAAHESPTLGLFKPKEIRRLIIERDQEDWTPDERAKLQQQGFFDQMPLSELEKLPYRFSYEFVCDDPACKSHKLSCTDWELGASFRDWRRRYGSGWEEKFRLKFERQMIEEKDTHFYVGNLHARQHIWIIIGLFYPPL